MTVTAERATAPTLSDCTVTTPSETTSGSTDAAPANSPSSRRRRDQSDGPVRPRRTASVKELLVELERLQYRAVMLDQLAHELGNLFGTEFADHPKYLIGVEGGTATPARPEVMSALEMELRRAADLARAQIRWRSEDARATAISGGGSSRPLFSAPPPARPPQPRGALGSSLYGRSPNAVESSGVSAKPIVLGELLRQPLGHRLFVEILEGRRPIGPALEIVDPDRQDAHLVAAEVLQASDVAGRMSDVPLKRVAVDRLVDQAHLADGADHGRSHLHQAESGPLGVLLALLHACVDVNALAGAHDEGGDHVVAVKKDNNPLLVHDDLASNYLNKSAERMAP